MNNSERETLIRESLNKAKDNGWKIVKFSTLFADNKECCPLGSTILDENFDGKNENSISNSKLIEKKLNAEFSWICSFMNAFDGYPFANKEKEAYELGIKFRKELLNE